MAIITDGVITIGRAASNYASKMAAEKDAWTMITNIAHNFFASLNEALREKGYTPAGAALWGACVITVSLAATYGAYKIYRWKFPLANNNPNPTPSEQTNAQKVFNDLQTYYNSNKDNLDLHQLNTQYLKLTGLPSYDKDLTTADKQLLLEIKSNIDRLQLAADKQEKDNKRATALKKLNEAVKGSDSNAINIAKNELNDAWSGDTLSTKVDIALKDATNRINEIQLGVKRKALEDVKNDDFDALVTALNEYLSASGEKSTSDDKQLVDDKKAALKTLTEAEAEKITNNIDSLSKDELNTLITKLESAKDFVTSLFDVQIAIDMASTKIAELNLETKKQELDEALAKDAADRDPESLQSLYDDELDLTAQLEQVEDPARKDAVQNAIKETYEKKCEAARQAVTVAISVVRSKRNISDCNQLKTTYDDLRKKAEVSKDSTFESDFADAIAPSTPVKK